MSAQTSQERGGQSEVAQAVTHIKEWIRETVVFLGHAITLLPYLFILALAAAYIFEELQTSVGALVLLPVALAVLLQLVWIGLKHLFFEG